MTTISSRTAAAELRRFERKHAALRGRLSRLIDAYAVQAAADIELKTDQDAPELRLLIRDLLAITRDEFAPEDRIAGDGVLGQIFKEISNEDEDGNHQIAYLQSVFRWHENIVFCASKGDHLRVGNMCRNSRLENTAMAYYEIENPQGAPLGVYAGTSPESALDTMARDGGYRNYAHLQRETHLELTEEELESLESDLHVREVPEHLRAAVAELAAGEDGLAWVSYESLRADIEER